MEVFFKNCKSEKVGEYVRGRQEGSRRREGEKNRDRHYGVKDVLFLKSFFLYLPVLISGSCAGDESESSYCTVLEMGRLRP